jgi:mono/diheme cytochrome c family protein
MLSRQTDIGTIIGLLFILYALFPTLKGRAAWPLANNLIHLDASIKKNLTAGKYIFNKTCTNCHGNKGKDAGCKEADLALSKTKVQTDGRFFLKISKGRKDMTANKKNISEEQLWQPVSNVCSFKIMIAKRNEPDSINNKCRS